MRVNALSVGMVIGLFLAVWHACWSALVALGWAQTLIDFMLWAHFIKLSLSVEPFSLFRAAILVGVLILLCLWLRS